MPKKEKFTPIVGDLSTLTTDQREAYVLAACDFLGVPPQLGLVVLQLMDVGDGARQLVLYVKKGATDIIRDNRKITIDRMEQINGEGYVGWMVTSRDSTGRQEIAVGTVSIVGLKGIAVANAVMTAQTKACRRVTLQFAGGGFLDETEVTEKTSNIATAAQPLSTIAQPSVKPNTEAGKDITPVPDAVTPLKVGDVVVLTDGKAATVEATGTSKKAVRGRPKKASVSLDTPSTVNEPGSPQAVAAKETPQVKVEPQPPIATVEATKPTPAGTKLAEATPTPEPLNGAVGAVKQPVAQAVESKDPEPLCSGTPPTSEQKDEFRKKLAAYTHETLAKAGFHQSEKLGGRNDKIKLFVKAMFPKATTKSLSTEQWAYLFEFMDKKIAEIGAEALVQLIHKQIGEEEAPSA